MENNNIPWQKEQSMALTFYMKSHDQFAAGRFVGANAKQNKLLQWERVSEKVTACGPLKTAKQCQAHWSKLKSDSKKYNAKKRKTLRLETGNDDQNEKFEFDLLLEKVLEVVGTSHNNGLEMAPEAGHAQVKKSNVKKGNKVVYIVPDAVLDVGIDPKGVKRPLVAVEPQHCSNYVKMDGLVQPKNILPSKKMKTEDEAHQEPKSLNASEKYSDYVSLWRKRNSSMGTVKAKSIEAVKENTESVKQLIEQIKALNEIQLKRFELERLKYDQMGN